MSGPLVSVVIPCYKSGPYIGRALEGIACQTYAHWEVIAVDDCGPKDGTHDTITQFAMHHAGRRVEIIRNPTNLGYGAARSTGIARASGDVLAMLDPDDYWGPRHLEVAIAALENADFFACQALSVDESGKECGLHIGGRFPDLSRRFPASLASENFILSSSTVMTRSAYEKVGTFSDDVCADWDHYLRAILVGCGFVFTEEINCFYRKHESALTRNYLNILKSATAVLSRHRSSATGAFRVELEDSLFQKLCRLAYLKISFRDWSGLSDAAQAASIRKCSLKPWIHALSGFKNNWKDLRQPAAPGR